MSKHLTQVIDLQLIAFLEHDKAEGGFHLTLEDLLLSGFTIRSFSDQMATADDGTNHRFLLLHLQR